MTTTAVPTIRDTVVRSLNEGGLGGYANHPVVDRIVQALVDRETNLHAQMEGGPMQGSASPVADEIQRRLDEGDDNLDARVTRLEEQVGDLISFARENGYRPIR
jgi:hypothetical protein